MALGSVGGAGASMVAKRYATDGLGNHAREQQRTQADEAARAARAAKPDTPPKPPVEAAERPSEDSSTKASGGHRLDLYL